MKRLLYIEDSLTSQWVMKKRLADVAEVSLSASMSESRQLLRDETYDLVVADCYLPDGNALNLVREIRAKGAAGQVPVIVVSASMDRLLLSQSLRVGANDCFAKPIPWPEFIAAVERMLSSPYARLAEGEGVAVTLIEGMVNDRHWLYCPEVNMFLEGDDLERLQESVLARTRELVTQGNVLPYVSGVKVNQHLVDAAARPVSDSAKPATSKSR
jgi:two-component system, CitB family, response regulator